jgi:hypothetical protein
MLNALGATSYIALTCSSQPGSSHKRKTIVTRSGLVKKALLPRSVGCYAKRFSTFSKAHAVHQALLLLKGEHFFSCPDVQFCTSFEAVMLRPGYIFYKLFTPGGFRYFRQHQQHGNG